MSDSRIRSRLIKKCVNEGVGKLSSLLIGYGKSHKCLFHGQMVFGVPSYGCKFHNTLDNQTSNQIAEVYMKTFVFINAV